MKVSPNRSMVKIRSEVFATAQMPSLHWSDANPEALSMCAYPNHGREDSASMLLCPATEMGTRMAGRVPRKRVRVSDRLPVTLSTYAKAQQGRNHQEHAEQMMHL